MNVLEKFLRETASILGISPEITEFGVSRTLKVQRNRTVVEIATNGPLLWLTANFDWPDFPTDGTFITWAPIKSIFRTKMMEGAGTTVTTGNPAFDAAYLIHGPGASVLSKLPPQIISLLLAHEHLRPHVTGLRLSQKYVFYERRHLRCEPSLFEGPPRPGDVALGTEKYIPACAALWAEELSMLVRSISQSVKGE